jgi:hypothetical protein
VGSRRANPGEFLVERNKEFNALFFYVGADIHEDFAFAFAGGNLPEDSEFYWAGQNSCIGRHGASLGLRTSTHDLGLSPFTHENNFGFAFAAGDTENGIPSGEMIAFMVLPPSFDVSTSSIGTLVGSSGSTRDTRDGCGNCYRCTQNRNCGVFLVVTIVYNDVDAPVVTPPPVTLPVSPPTESSASPPPEVAEVVPTVLISGRMLDSAGVPMANVLVALFSAPLTTITDSDGNFAIPNAQVGTHTLRIFGTQADFEAYVIDPASVTPLAEIANVVVGVNSAGEATVNGNAGDLLQMTISDDGAIGIAPVTVSDTATTTDSGNPRTGIEFAVIPILLSSAVMIVVNKKSSRVYS